MGKRKRAIKDDSSSAEEVVSEVEEIEVEEIEEPVKKQKKIAPEEDTKPDIEKKKKKVVRDGTALLGKAMSALSFKEARELMKNDKSLFAIKEKRTFVLNWSGCENQVETIWKIVEKSVGQYNRKVKGIPIAIGKILVKPTVILVESGQKIHLEAVIPQIVFRPKKEAYYTCEIVSVDPKFANGLLFNKIAVSITDQSKDKSILIHAKEGDKMQFVFTEIQVRGRICQIRGKIIKKAGGFKGGAKARVEKDAKIKKKAKKTFSDSD